MRLFRLKYLKYNAGHPTVLEFFFFFYDHIRTNSESFYFRNTGNIAQNAIMPQMEPSRGKSVLLTSLLGFLVYLLKLVSTTSLRSIATCALQLEARILTATLVYISCQARLPQRSISGPRDRRERTAP
jgi:hypothetical protein